MLRSSLHDYNYKWSIKPQSSLTVIITSKNDLDFTKAMKTLSYQTLKHQPPGVCSTSTTPFLCDSVDWQMANFQG